jgi:hypothetical protein
MYFLTCSLIPVNSMHARQNRRPSDHALNPNPSPSPNRLNQTQDDWTELITRLVVPVQRIMLNPSVEISGRRSWSSSHGPRVFSHRHGGLELEDGK